MGKWNQFWVIGAIFLCTPGQSFAASSLTWEEAASLSRYVVPFQTRGFVGVQGAEREREMTVTPGNRFLSVLKEHALRDLRLRKDPLTALQQKRVDRILVRTRDRLIEQDGLDLALIQRFEALVTTPSVDVAEVGRVNGKIGAVEGKEGAIFLSALKSLQTVLSSGQKKGLEEQGRETLPSLRVDLSPAVFFADRILAIRWNILLKNDSLTDPVLQKKYLAIYGKERDAITRLGIAMTVDDRRAADLLEAPWVDFAALSKESRQSGPDEGAFWGELVQAIKRLNPPENPRHSGGS